MGTKEVQGILFTCAVGREWQRDTKAEGEATPTLLFPAPVSLVYLSSARAILRFPLIWRQWPVGYDVLTNVAIMVMRLVWLAPASVEQGNACGHARSLSGLLAFGNAHQRVDGRGRVRARKRLDLGDLLRSAAWNCRYGPS